jgi:nitrogen regulatory protein P-II 1
MKNLTLIAHADIKEKLADALRNLEQVPEFMFTQVESHGARDEFDTALSARDSVIGYTPHVRVDILLKSGDVDDVLQTLRAADCGLAGSGTYQVTTVERHGAL